VLWLRSKRKCRCCQARINASYGYQGQFGRLPRPEQGREPTYSASLLALARLGLRKRRHEVFSRDIRDEVGAEAFGALSGPSDDRTAGERPLFASLELMSFRSSDRVLVDILELPGVGATVGA
jgi:hypothetical protein